MGRQMADYADTDYPFKDITEKIIGAAFRVHNRLGSGFLEKVYENALAKELIDLGLKAEQQKPLEVNYGGKPIGNFSVDLLVEDNIVVELKAVHSLDKSFEKKLLHYLKVSGFPVGLLINFGKKVEVKRKVFTQPTLSASSAISDPSAESANISGAESAEISGRKLGDEYIHYCRRRLMQEYLPRILRCLSELSEEDVWWRADEPNNSIGNLILHLSGNVRQWIITGIGGAKDTRDRPKEFSERGPIPKEELSKKIETTLREADDVLAHFDAGRMLEVRHIQKYDVTCLETISHVVEHFAQHLGQIIYITKLRKGTDLKFYDL